MENLNDNEKLDEFINIHLPNVRKNRPPKGKGSYYTHETEEYLSAKIYKLNFIRGDFIATNLDWMFYSKSTKKLMLIDQKTENAGLSEGQKILFKMFDNMLKSSSEFEYLGCYVLQFEYYCFEDGGEVKLVQMFSHNPIIIKFNNYDEFKKYMKKTFKQ